MLARSYSWALRSASRAMSTSAPKLFLVTAPDYSDSNALARRLAVRDSHLEEARKMKADGILQLGGAMLDDSGNMVGSTLLIATDSLESARELMERDYYYRHDVWDKARLSIVSFRRAL
ncbi:hypothetical protein EXIGLDRAFT_150652 [Exidia glandulosa HHB12029]|uniref:YCII-related domain-containing protein n=1 Tax=Exidia glandulosa HHB12029 TaxID=1314781 RepID=A0A165FKB2_EXIGL|nr:hypothetical protein EXIGLDRAFT_150652 [Exidia glandulosa HHB12029]